MLLLEQPMLRKNRLSRKKYLKGMKCKKIKQKEMLIKLIARKIP